MVANFSRDRRRTALSMLRRSEFQSAPLSDDARLTYAVGLLICDESGRIAQSDLHAAMNDPSVVQAARALLVRAAR